jgi:hypothetical protein
VAFLIWLESTAISVWIRESPSLWAFPFILFLHTLGLALLAGISTAFAIWVIRFAQTYPIAPMRQYFPYMWLGLAINTVSGLLLLAAYPAKALTNPVFYVKLVAIFAALAILGQLERRLFVGSNPRQALTPSVTNKRLALVMIALWLVATGTGRFLAYTHRILMASEPGFY